MELIKFMIIFLLVSGALCAQGEDDDQDPITCFVYSHQDGKEEYLSFKLSYANHLKHCHGKKFSYCHTGRCQFTDNTEGEEICRTFDTKVLPMRHMSGLASTRNFRPHKSQQ